LQEVTSDFNEQLFNQNYDLTSENLDFLSYRPMGNTATGSDLLPNTLKSDGQYQMVEKPEIMVTPQMCDNNFML